MGIVECRREALVWRVRQLRRMVERDGMEITLGRVLGRVYDRVRNARQDRSVLAGFVDDAANRAVIEAAGIPVFVTEDYSAPAMLKVVRGLEPDILVVHTKYFVGRAVRELAPVTVLGGHPGITPHYRGAYSPFWALLHGRPEMVGWTVFTLDGGMDTGPVVVQEKLDLDEFEPTVESHLTLAWRAMAREAEAQADIIRQLDRGESVDLRVIEEVPANSYFGIPRLRDFLRYKAHQRRFR